MNNKRAGGGGGGEEDDDGEYEEQRRSTNRKNKNKMSSVRCARQWPVQGERQTRHLCQAREEAK